MSVACMGAGDTEFTGIVDETRSKVQLSCTVIKNKRLPCARIEKPDGIVAVGSTCRWSTPFTMPRPISCSGSKKTMACRRATLQHVAGVEYPSRDLFNAIAPKRKRVAKKANSVRTSVKRWTIEDGRLKMGD